MGIAAVVGAVGILFGGGSADTTLAVRPGQVLEVLGLDGHVTIEGVSGDALTIEVERETRGREMVHVQEHRDVIAVRAGSEGNPGQVRLLVPRWMAVRVDLKDGALEVRGLRADLNALVNDGPVTASDLEGEISIRAVDGRIDLQNVRGRLDVESADDGIHVEGAEGALTLHSIDGNIVLTDAVAEVLEMTTVDGDIRFEGWLRGAGRSELTTHDGNVVVVLHEPRNLSLRAVANDGSIETEFPARVRHRGEGSRIEFELGSGARTLFLQSFDGNVRVLRGR